MNTFCYDDLARYDPTIPADWRWWRAEFLLAAADPYLAGNDAVIARAYEFLRYLTGGGRQPPAGTDQQYRDQEDLAVAFQIYQTGGTQRLELESRLLAGQTSEAIAQRMSLSVAAVDVFADLYFDVRPRLLSSDWIVRHAIRRWPSDSLDARLGIVLKTFAYFGKEYLLEALLPYCTDGGVRLQQPSDLSTEAGRLDVRLKLSILIEVVQIDETNVMQLFKLHAGILEIERQRSAATTSHESLAPECGNFLNDEFSGLFAKQLPFMEMAQRMLANSVPNVDLGNADHAGAAELTCRSNGQGARGVA